MSSSSPTKCWCCNGTGQVQGEPIWSMADLSPSWYSMESRWARCDICEGAGYIYPLECVTCRECSGRGSIEAKYTLFGIFKVRRMTNCLACEGRGFTRRRLSGGTIRHTSAEIERQQVGLISSFGQADEAARLRVTGDELNGKVRPILAYRSESEGYNG